MNINEMLYKKYLCEKPDQNKNEGLTYNEQLLYIMSLCILYSFVYTV